LPLRQTSSWRTLEHNARVGGDRASQHLIGTAADYYGSEAAMQEGARRFNRLNPHGYAAVHDVGSGRHLHVQYYRAGVVPRAVFERVAR